MTYVDSDGEHITISHEIEFLEAVALQSPLKLIVKGVSDVQSSQPVGSASNESTRQRMVEIKEAAKIGGVQAQQVAAPPCPAVDSVSKLYTYLQSIHKCAGQDSSKVNFEYEPIQGQGFRCRVVLRLGGADDGDYAWSQTRPNKQAAKRDAAMLALASLVPASSEQEDGPLLGESVPLARPPSLHIEDGALCAKIMGAAIGEGEDSKKDIGNTNLTAQPLAAVTEAASGGASDISGWLRQIGIAEEDVDSVLLHFHKPEYGVKTLCELFALEEDDVDEILCSLPLAKKRLIKTRLKANT